MVTAQQGALEVGPGSVQAFDLVVERGEAPTGNRLPRIDFAGVEDTIDLVEAEAGVLEDVNEHEPPDRPLPVAALPRYSGVGLHQPSALVVPDGRGSQSDPGADLTDGQEMICHETT